MEHIKLLPMRLLNLVGACDELQHWKELIYLYILYDVVDAAFGVFCFKMCMNLLISFSLCSKQVVRLCIQTSIDTASCVQLLEY